MLNLTHILMLALLPLLLLLSAFFSGGETAIFSLSSHQRLQLRQVPSVVARTVTRLLDERRAVLVTVLLCNMIVNVLYFLIGTVLVISLHRDEMLTAATGSLLHLTAFFLLILIGEIFPKLVARRYAQRWSSLAVLPLMVIHRALIPVRAVLIPVIVSPLSRLLAPRQQPSQLSTEDVESLLELSQHQGAIDDQEERLLQEVLSLSQIRVKNLMKPRVDIKAFNLTDDPRALIAMAGQTRFSRIPVYRANLDQIVGIVYSRQVLLVRPHNTKNIAALIRPVKFIPELQRADRLLVELRKRGTSMAIAVDEYGGTAGLLTLEDVVEKMVGQIANHNEADQTPQVQAIEPNRWRVSAQLGIREWSGVFGPIAPTAGVSTIGGLIMARLGRVPNVGDHIHIDNLLIEVETMNSQRIESLVLQLHPGTKTTAHP